jgi:hypothetical protein
MDGDLLSHCVLKKTALVKAKVKGYVQTLYICVGHGELPFVKYSASSTRGYVCQPGGFECGKHFSCGMGSSK